MNAKGVFLKAATTATPAEGGPGGIARRHGSSLYRPRLLAKKKLCARNEEEIKPEAEEEEQAWKMDEKRNRQGEEARLKREN